MEIKTATCKIVVSHCPNCGVVFGVPEAFDTDRKAMLYTVQEWNVETGQWRNMSACEWITLSRVILVLADFKEKAPVADLDELLRVMPAKQIAPCPGEYEEESRFAKAEMAAERRNEYALELGTGIYEEEREP